MEWKCGDGMGWGVWELDGIGGGRGGALHDALVALLCTHHQHHKPPGTSICSVEVWELEGMKGLGVD